MKIYFIKENNYIYISINWNVDYNYKISEDNINSFMDYIYVFSIKELEDTMNIRFWNDNFVTHEDIFNYINKNFLTSNESDFIDDKFLQYDYANEVIPKIVYDDKKQIIHKKALIEGVKFFFKNTSFISNEVLFTGWTSLLIKDNLSWQDYIRFSLDLDFSFYHNTVDQGILLWEIENTADFIITFLTENGCFVNENANWKDITFEFPWYWIASIKLDWMPNFNSKYEYVNLDWVTIPKASDEDIVANKLKRLNERDIDDIIYLSNKINIDMLINALKEKSNYDHWNEYAFYPKIKSLWLKHSNIELINYLINVFQK